jgi:class 3 adenylate cyclase
MRSGLPVGTVTFLFTDIEGSTRFLQEAAGIAAAANAREVSGAR